MPKGRKKEFVGYIKSDKMNKTVVVKCKRRCHHPLYKKVITKYSSFMADNSGNKAKVGDKVRIVETRPLSKNKRWYVAEILEKAKLISGENTSDSNANDVKSS